MRKLFLAVALLFFGVACSAQNETSEVNQVEQVAYETIDIDEIDRYVADGYTVVDVREVDEYESGHITDALNVPLSGLENGEFGNLNKDEPYVIICRSGNRSQTASQILIDEGYDVVNVSEGMSTWTGDIE